MTRRKDSRRYRTVASVVDALPERFLAIDFMVDPQMNGLRLYYWDLQRHLSAELGYEVDQKQVFDVMAGLGVPVTEWYRLGFVQDAQRSRIGALFSGSDIGDMAFD